MSATRYCRDCKHATFERPCDATEPESDGYVWWCGTPELGVSLVTGQPITRRCAEMRDGWCGSSGLFFDPISADAEAAR